jgi:hypothetical protein
MNVRIGAFLAGAAALLMTVPTARAEDQLVQGGRSAGFSGFSDWDSRPGPDRFRRAEDNVKADRRAPDFGRDNRGGPSASRPGFGGGPGGPGGPGARFGGPPQQDFRRDGGRGFAMDWRGGRGPMDWRAGGNFGRGGPAFGRGNDREFGRGGNFGWASGRGNAGRGFAARGSSGRGFSARGSDGWRGRGPQGRGGPMANRYAPGRGGFGAVANRRGGQRPGMNRGGWRGGVAARGRMGRGRGGCGHQTAGRANSNWRRGFGASNRSGRGGRGFGFGPSNRFGFNNFNRGWADRGPGFGEGNRGQGNRGEAYRGQPQRPQPPAARPAAPPSRQAAPARPAAPAAPASRGGSDLERRLESLMRDVEDLRRALRR